MPDEVSRVNLDHVEFAMYGDGSLALIPTEGHAWVLNAQTVARLARFLPANAVLVDNLICAVETALASAEVYWNHPDHEAVRSALAALKGVPLPPRAPPPALNELKILALPGETLDDLIEAVVGHARTGAQMREVFDQFQTRAGRFYERRVR